MRDRTGPGPGGGLACVTVYMTCVPKSSGIHRIKTGFRVSRHKAQRINDKWVLGTPDYRVQYTSARHVAEFALPSPIPIIIYQAPASLATVPCERWSRGLGGGGVWLGHVPSFRSVRLHLFCWHTC